MSCRALERMVIFEAKGDLFEMQLLAACHRFVQATGCSEVSAFGSFPVGGLQSVLEEGADACVFVGVGFGSLRLSAPEAASTVGSCCV